MTPQQPTSKGANTDSIKYWMIQNTRNGEILCLAVF